MSIDRLSPKYWDNHSIGDPCSTGNFAPFSWREVLKTFPAQKAIVLEFLNRPRIGTQTFADFGEAVNPRDFPLGSILEIDRESVIVERAKSNPELWRWVLTGGLWQTNFPWNEPEYRQSTYFGVVTDLESSGKNPVRGLVTFNSSIVTSDYEKAVSRGLVESDPIHIGVVQHTKLHERLQANDRQVFKRVNRVTLFA